MSGHDWTTAHEAADEALRITQHDRNKANGDPEDNFAYIALAWTASLRARGLLAADAELIDADVARMMALLKLIRDSNAPHRDNRTDTFGYTLCLERVEPTEPLRPPHFHVAPTVAAAREIIDVYSEALRATGTSR